MLQYIQTQEALAMRGLIKSFVYLFLLPVVLATAAIPVYSADSEEFSSEKMISDLEKKMDLTREQWEKLKPVLDEKGKELSQEMKDSVDRGFAELDKMTKKFDSMSKNAEQKVKDLLNSEEAMKLREHLAKIDQEAIDKAKEEMIAKLNELLELTEEQAKKLQPVLEDSFNQLSDKIMGLTEEGTRNWIEFKEEFDKLTQDLYDKVKETLNQEQMQKLEKYNEDQKEDIQRTLFTV